MISVNDSGSVKIEIGKNHSEGFRKKIQLPDFPTFLPSGHLLVRTCEVM